MMVTVSSANTKARTAKRHLWSRKRRWTQYPGGVAGPSTFGHTNRLTGEELNTLSYLVRKYPQEAMQYLSINDMNAEIKERGGVPTLTDDEVIDECLKRHIIEI